jgi:HAD superfamily hydrolase (TIGR01509 family)
MAGDLLMEESARAAGVKLTERKKKTAESFHGKVFARLDPRPRPLPGAIALLRALSRAKIPYGIATSGKRESIKSALRGLTLPSNVIVIDGAAAEKAKPEPDLFLLCREQLAIPATDCFVIGDAIWDMLAARRAGMLPIGLLSGGRGEEELYRAGALRVYQGAADLLGSIHQLGIHI